MPLAPFVPFSALRAPTAVGPDQVDEIQTVTTDDAFAMAQRLAREEGLFAGASSGANVVAALRVAHDPFAADSRQQAS
jgi:cysteine synthase